jgi:hypothetical protein
MFLQSVERERLALYFDSDSSPWSVDKPWEELQPSEWSQVPSCYVHLQKLYLGEYKFVCSCLDFAIST